MRRQRYWLERGAAGEGGGAKADAEQGSLCPCRQPRGRRRHDWLYESYYCMSQQHPLLVFLLLIVMGACLALLVVFFLAAGLVSVCPLDGAVPPEQEEALPSMCRKPLSAPNRPTGASWPAESSPRHQASLVAESSGARNPQAS